MCIKERGVDINLETMVANYSLFSIPLAFLTAYYPSVMRVSICANYQL